MEFLKFIGNYASQFGYLDLLIWTVGVFFLAMQVTHFVRLFKTTAAIGPSVFQLEQKSLATVRWATFGIDALPILGLIGTVASLLQTLGGLADSNITASVIANFAPALTTTISGLITSLLNLAFLELILRAQIGQFRRRGRGDG